jgi:hypothetical protein
MIMLSFGILLLLGLWLAWLFLAQPLGLNDQLKRLRRRGRRRRY